MTHNRFIHDRNKRKWEVSHPDHGTRPPYALPWSTRDMTLWVTQDYDVHQLCEAFLPLPYMARPMWPCEWDNETDPHHPERFLSLFCVACKCHVIVGQIVLHMVSGIYRETGAPGITVNGRLLCHSCCFSRHVMMESLSWFPYMLLLQYILDKCVLPSVQGTLKCEYQLMAVYKHKCGMCNVNLQQVPMEQRRTLKTHHQYTITVCGEACAYAYMACMWIAPLQQACLPCMTPLERIHYMLDHMAQHASHNLMRHLTHASCDHCHKSFKLEYMTSCHTCRRAYYCGPSCRKKHYAIHAPLCCSSKETFSIERLDVLYERMPSLSHTLRLVSTLQLCCPRIHIRWPAWATSVRLNGVYAKIDLRHLKIKGGYRGKLTSSTPLSAHSPKAPSTLHTL